MTRRFLDVRVPGNAEILRTRSCERHQTLPSPDRSVRRHGDFRGASGTWRGGAGTLGESRGLCECQRLATRCTAIPLVKRKCPQGGVGQSVEYGGETKYSRNELFADFASTAGDLRDDVRTTSGLVQSRDHIPSFRLRHLACHSDFIPQIASCRGKVRE
jgi:hypothetical protein